MFTWQWQTWLWGPGSTDTLYVYMAMTDLVMRAREHWHSLCLHGDDRPGYESQGALTHFMFTWRWQTWLWGPRSTDTVYVYMAIADLLWGPGSTDTFYAYMAMADLLWGPGSTDTVYVYMVMADMVITRHWHNLCLFGSDKNRDYDFLSSIEVLILDQTEFFIMQNWDHILVSHTFLSSLLFYFSMIMNNYCCVLVTVINHFCLWGFFMMFCSVFISTSLWAFFLCRWIFSCVFCSGLFCFMVCFDSML